MSSFIRSCLEQNLGYQKKTERQIFVRGNYVIVSLCWCWISQTGQVYLHAKNKLDFAIIICKSKIQNYFEMVRLVQNLWLYFVGALQIRGFFLKKSKIQNYFEMARLVQNVWLYFVGALQIRGFKKKKKIVSTKRVCCTKWAYVSNFRISCL